MPTPNHPGCEKNSKGDNTSQVGSPADRASLVIPADNEVLYTLLSIPSIGIKGMNPVATAGISAEKLVKGGKQFFDW